MRGSGRHFWQSALAVGLLASPVRAQVVPPSTPAIPGRPQVEQPPGATAPVRNKVAVDAGTALQQAPCPLAGSDVRARIDRVRFEAPDGTAPAAPLMAALAGIAPEAGDQPIEQVCAIRDRANEALAARGWVALVQIPPQEITDGTLRLQVVAARLVEIRVSGDDERFRKALAPRIARLKALDPLNQREAERLLLEANDLPGVSMRLALRPAGTTPGDVIGDLVVEADRGALLLNVQNMSARVLGPWVGSIRGELYGLTGMGDRTWLGFSNSAQWDETHVVQGGHDFAIGTRGLRTGIRASYAISNPDIPDLDLNTRSLIAGWDVSMPLTRALHHELRLAGGLEILNQRTIVRQAGDAIPFTRDKLRVVFVRAEGSFRTVSGNGREIWRVRGNVELRKGTGLFGATRTGEAEDGFQPSRFAGNPQAFVARGGISQELAPLPWLVIGAEAYGQWANDPLLNLEEFVIGNLTFGRGYDPGANGADRAVAFRAEPRIRLPLRRDTTVDLLGFYDWARIWNLDPGSQENGRTLQSWGGGLRVGLPGLLTMDIMYAKPRTPALSTDPAPPPGRVLMSLTAKLLPWGGRR